MPRPGLVVGLGGTGQWVLTWLKRDLLLSNNGQMPKNVRLLEIDTSTRLEAGASRIAAGGRKEEAAIVGGVTLTDSEFIYVGGDSRKIAESVREGEYKQIGQWYQAGKWLTTQAPATFILDDGAGRLRQFGRMAIFKDLLNQESSSRVWRALRVAIEGVRSATSEQRRLEVMVVGSFAGGTGSGMFIDVALILRMLAQQLGVHHVLRGFFALPSVFTTAPDAEMKARSFAAWRELNRFMVVDPNFPMPLIQYVEDNPQFAIRSAQRLFDACYLVDGKRSGQPIAEEAKYGVFPMMSETVSAILDEEAGTAYTQWIFTNLAPEYARRPETPMYSAVGAFTVQVPAHFVQEVSGHAFAQEMLLKLLSPRRLPDAEGRLTTSGAERHMALAAPDQNLEDRGFAGRQRSLGLLREGITYASGTAKPTNFHGRVAQLIDAISSGNAATVTQQLAQAGGSNTAAGWRAYFPDLGGDPKFEATHREVEEHMSYDVRRVFGRREGEKEEEARSRLKNMPEDVRKRFGGISSSGEEAEDWLGACGDALKKCEDIQLIIFRQLVLARVPDILMGHSENPIVARGGKLGYAWDYFDGLVSDLARFLGLMSDVKKQREQIKPELRFVGLSKKAQDMLNATRGKKFLLVFEHPNVRGAEQQYLEAHERLVDLRREDILHHYVVETVAAMKAICEETRDAIQHWIWHLSTGDDASQLPGMWDGVRTGLQQVENAHSFDTITGKVQMLVADKTLQVSEADLQQALRQWEWLASFEGEPPRITIRARIVSEASGEPPEELADPSLQVSAQLRMDVGRQNQERLLGLVKGRFAGVAARTTVAAQIKREFPQSKSFASQVAGVSAEPLFEGASGANPRKKSNLIRVKTDPNDPYYVGPDGLEGELRAINHLDRGVRDDVYGIQVVQSENPFKLTLVRTDDLYEYQHFAAWGECQKSYADHMKDVGQPLDPVLMQNFAAEARAVEIERRLTRDPYNRKYQPLHPRVVMLLEDPRALRQFLYLGMSGKITEEDSKTAYRWQLTWTKSSGAETIWLSRGWNADLDASQRPKPDIFNAIHGYVIMKETQEAGRNYRVDTDLAQRLIDQEMNALGPQGEIDLLENNLKPGGFVGWLKSLGYDPDVPDRVTRKDFADLALVCEMMLHERLDELKAKELKAAARTTGRGPFKTTQDIKATPVVQPAATSETQPAAQKEAPAPEQVQTKSSSPFAKPE